MATPEQPVAPAPAPAPQPYKPSSAATLAAAGQGATAASHAAVTPTLVASGVQARAIAEATGRIVDALTSFSTKRRQTIIPLLMATLTESFADRTPTEISMLLGKEQAREREFLRRQARRIARDMPKVLAEADLDDRREAMRKLMRREQRYMAQRERAMTARAHSAVESLDLEEASPEGAYWLLGGPVSKHTPGCVAMANRFWPWPVLRDVIHPPVHPGCPCSLISLDEAVMRGFMTHEQLPDVKDALIRARRNMALEEALAETYPAWQIADEMAMLELEELEEAAVHAHRGEGHHSPQLRFAKGLVKGGQFMPKLGTSDRVKTKSLVPHVHGPKPGGGRKLGRSVYMQGNRVHIPEDRHFSRHVGGNHYTSPAGSTNVYRNGKLASTPDAPSMHPDFERPRKGTKKGKLTPKGPGTPQALRDAEKAKAERAGKRVERAVGSASKDVSPVHEGDSAHAAHKALKKGGFKHDEAGAKTTTNTLVVGYSHKDGHELTVTYDRHTSKVRSATWKPAKKPEEPAKKAEAPKPAKDVAAPEKATRTPSKPRSEPKPDATLGTGDQAWSRQVERAQAGDAHAQWDLAAEAAARGPRSDFTAKLKEAVGADKLRRWREGSRWPGPVPQGAAPARYEVAHVSGGDHGPAVGVAMHSVAAGRPGDGSGRMFGTGRYFTSGQGGQDGQGLSLAGARLHRAQNTEQARSLGHALSILNGIADGNGESTQMLDQTGEMRHYTVADVIAHLPDGMAGRDSRLFAEHAIALHQSGHDESAGTHMMRAHGYDGVDNRHLPALDVPEVGSVVYAPQGHEGEHSPEAPGMEVKQYEGEVGNSDHITRSERGHLPLAAVAHLLGARGEVPGDHRNKSGKDWEKFKADIDKRGIQDPIFITVDHNGDPKISEGNHRRDAAVELGHEHVPVEVRYYGHAERQGTVAERAGHAGEASPDRSLEGTRLRDALGSEWHTLPGFQQDAAELYVLGASEEINSSGGHSYYDEFNDRDVPIAKIADALDGAMKPLPVSAVVYRGVESGTPETARGGFTSTALTKDGAREHGSEVLRIEVPAGTPALWLGPLTEGEDELLLGRGARFEKLPGDKGYRVVPGGEASPARHDRSQPLPAPRAVRAASGEASPAQGGAVVRGVVGRWVWVRGRYTHVPHDAAWSETVDGVKFSSPAGGTAVYRKAEGDHTDLGELVSGPGVRARHADVRNPRTGGTARGATTAPAGAVAAPEAPPAPEVVTPDAPEVPRVRHQPDGHGLYINDDRRRSLLDSGTTVGVSHSLVQLEPVNISGVHGESGGNLVTGGPWQRMTPNERQYALDHEYGRDLASAIDGDHTSRDEMGSLWTGGHFTDANGQHLDRYNAPAAVAQAYAQMNGEHWQDFAARFPDVSRWVATQAQNRRYHVRADVKEWLDGPQTGNVHDPVGELPGDARRLAQSTVGRDIDAAYGILGRAGYTRSPMTDGGVAVFRKVDPENQHVLTIALTGRSRIQSADGTAYGFDANQVPAEGDTPERHAYELRGQTFQESQTSLADRGYFLMNTSYRTNAGDDTRQIWVRPDSAGSASTALIVTTGSGPQHLDRRVLDARPSVLNAAEERARLTAVAKDRPDLALTGLLHDDTARIIDGTQWRRSSPIAGEDPRHFTYDLVRNVDADHPERASHDAWRVQVRDVGGQLLVEHVGRPGERDGTFAADDAEWQQRREVQTHEMRTLAAARRGRIDHAKDLVRSETNAGRAPDLQHMSGADASTALGELGYRGGSAREVRGGTSTTWTNRQTGTRLSVRNAPSGAVLSTRLLTRGAPDHGRDRTPEGVTPATMEQIHADVLGYSDELAAFWGSQTDARTVGTDPNIGGFAGLHRQWTGQILLGTSVEPAIQRALDAQREGRTLPLRDQHNAITAYRTLAHEMTHSVHGERGNDSYNAEDGGKGIEESLTAELEVHAAYDLMRRHGMTDLLEAARNGAGQGQVYQRHRENFRGLLADMGLGGAGPDQLRSLFQKWKFQDTDEYRREDFALRISEHRGMSMSAAHDYVSAVMRADNTQGNENVSERFRPILTNTVPAAIRQEAPAPPAPPTPPPAPPTPPTPPPGSAQGPTASLSDSGKVTVGARVRGNSTGQLATVTAVEGSQITVRRDDGSTATYGGDQYSSVAVTSTGMALPAGARVSSGLGPDGQPQVGRLVSVDWSDPQNPRAELVMTVGGRRVTVPARDLRSEVGHAWMLPLTRRDGSAAEASEGSVVNLSDGRTVTLVDSALSSWPTGNLTYTAVTSDGQRIAVPREGIVGFAGELPRPSRASSVEIQAGMELGRTHYNREDGSQQAGVVGNALVSRIGAPAIEAWARANDVPLRGASGDRAIAQTYQEAFASKERHDELQRAQPQLYDATMQLAREAGLPTPNWDTRVTPGTTEVPAGEITEEHVARAIFTGTFGRAGYTTRVVSASRSSSGGISIEGRVMDARGSQVGTFTRRVTRNEDGSFGVYNAYLKLNGDAQGTGFASAFNRHCFEQYRQKGVREVTVSANIDVGGYTWAATGFDFQATSSDQTARAKERATQAKRLVDSALRMSWITAAERNSIRDRLWDGTGPLLDTHVQHAWELAHIDAREAGRRDPNASANAQGHDAVLNPNLGQKIMLDTSWSGIRLMDAPDPTAAPPAAPAAPVAPAAPSGVLPLSTTRPAGTTATARLRQAEGTFAGAGNISSREVREAVSDVAEIIEAAHPGLVARRPTIAVGAMTHRGASAEYGLDGSITLASRPSRRRRSMDLAHEYGHHIDNQILGRIGGGTGSAELAAFRQAVRDSGVLDRLAAFGRRGSGGSPSYARYASAGDEVWARAYARWLASKSDNPRIQAEAEAVSRQVGDWPGDSFAPVGAAIDALMAAIRPGQSGEASPDRAPGAAAPPAAGTTSTLGVANTDAANERNLLQGRQIPKTRALVNYVEKRGDEINDVLRHGRVASPQDERHAASLRNAFATGKGVHALDDDLVLYRGMAFPNTDDLMGREFQDMGLTSTSTDARASKLYADVAASPHYSPRDPRHVPARTPILLRMHVARGTKVMEGNVNDSELVLGPGTRYTIVGEASPGVFDAVVVSP